MGPIRGDRFLIIIPFVRQRDEDLPPVACRQMNPTVCIGKRDIATVGCGLDLGEEDREVRHDGSSHRVAVCKPLFCCSRRKAGVIVHKRAANYDHIHTAQTEWLHGSMGCVNRPRTAVCSIPGCDVAEVNARCT